MIDKVSLIVPGHNNLRYIKNTYKSIREYYDDVEIVLMDDGSDDGTWEWLESVGKQDDNVILFKSEKRVGHTILYDKGIELTDKKIVGILHADMILGPNYLENLLKHLKPGNVVCATRVEPPLHPAGKEKIVMDFGLEHDTIDWGGFNNFCKLKQEQDKGKTTKGMFAPWLLYKSDFESVGGHDPVFAPFPYEDSDIFQRWILNGYKMVQSRDSFVYHLTCRGHRWTKEIGKNDDYFTKVEEKARYNYIRKWGSWIENDSYQHPVIPPRYDRGIEITNSNSDSLYMLEPWFDNIKSDYGHDFYIKNTQSNTSIDLSKKFVDNLINDVVVKVDMKTFTKSDMQFIHQLNKIIQESGEPGEFKLGNLHIVINKVEDKVNELIKL